MTGREPSRKNTLFLLVSGLLAFSCSRSEPTAALSPATASAKAQPDAPSSAGSVAASPSPGNGASLPVPAALPKLPDAIPDAVLTETNAAHLPAPSFSVDRARLGDGVDLVVAVRRAEELDGTPLFAMALVQGGRVLSRRDGLTALTGVDEKALAASGSCDARDWQVVAAAEDLGTEKGIRVGAGCRYGEDYYTGTELAVVYRLSTPAPRDFNALERLWSGEGAYLHSEMDSCMTSRETHLRLIDARTLEKTVIEQTRWVDQQMHPDMKMPLKQRCKVGKAKKMERIALPGSR